MINGMAMRLEYSAGIEAEYSDNPMLLSEDERDDLSRSALAGFSFSENSSRLIADINSLIEYKDYRDDTFSDEVWFYLNGSANWAITPSVFYWQMQDYFSQQERDVLLPGTSDNLINTNAFSTGPDLYIRINPVNKISLSLRFNDYEFESTDTDSERIIFNTAWINTLSSSDSISLNVEIQDANYDNTEEYDFERGDVFISYVFEPSRNRFQFDLGYTNIDRNDADNIEGNLTKLQWRNQFRQNSYFLLDVSSQYTDTGLDLIASGSLNNEFDRSGQQISGDVFYDKRLDATYRIGSGSSIYTFLLRLRDEDYEDQPLDRISKGARLSLDYNYSAITSINTEIQYNDYENTDVSQEDQEKLATLGINYRLSRNYTIRCEYNYMSQQSNVASAEYDENRLFISLFYGRDPGSYR